MSVPTPQTTPIPSGTLTFGLPTCPPNANLHWRWHTGGQVQISAFEMGRFAVTNREYRAYLQATGAEVPSHIGHPGFDGDDQPVVAISWHDATAYCQWLAAGTGQPFRLPRDAEWEYAARGGSSSTIFPWGNALDPQFAYFGGQAAPKPVGSFPANGFGLHDMIGNVWQWCEDIYEEVSEGVKSVNKPTGKPTEPNRVLRGGSYMTTNLLNLYIAYRHEDPDDLRHESIGFRVILEK